MAGIKAPKLISLTNAGTVATAGPVTATTPRCPKPKKGKGGKKQPRRLLTAGGFTTSTTNLQNLPIFVQSMSSGGWLASGIKTGMAPTGTLSITSQAVCF
jgi:hypothetical protein